MNSSALILASSSKYRQKLLKQLRLPFTAIAPNIDEQTLPGEQPDTLVQRLATAKAKALADQHPHSLIIASDQVAGLNQQILTKPYTQERAIEQLLACSGKSVIFYTGLALFNTESKQLQYATETYNVTFRELKENEIRNYIAKETPLDCAGSFKMEGLGISLFSRLEGNDPNTLIGLPLIRLTEFLINEGFNPLLHT